MSVVINIRAEDLPKVLAAHSKNLPQAIKKGLTLAAHRGRSYLVRQSPVDLGQYKNSWKVKFDSHGPYIRNDAPHAGVIELGARPHKMSRAGLEAIAAWAKRKILNGGMGSRKAYVASGKPLSKKAMSTSGKKGQHWADVEAMSIAWAVAKKLEKHGQKGRFILQKATPQLIKIMAIETAKEINKALKDKGF